MESSGKIDVKAMIDRQREGRKVLNVTAELACPDCVGEGTYECECCGSEVGCEHCEETGLNPEVLDIKAIRDTERAWKVPTWDLRENGKTVGRCGSSLGGTPIHILRYEDFRRPRP